MNLINARSLAEARGIGVVKPDAVRAEGHEEIVAGLAQGLAAERGDLGEAQARAQRVAHRGPAERDGRGDPAHRGVGLADEHRAREVAVVARALAHGIEQEGVAVAQRALHAFGGDPADHHEHTAVAAARGLGIEAAAQLAVAGAGARGLCCRQRRRGVRGRGDPHQLEFAR